MTGQIVVNVDTSIQYQTMTGFEAQGWMSNWDTQWQIDHLQDWNRIIAGGAARLGIDRVRIEVQSGSENPVDYFSQYINGDITRAQWKPHWYESINDNSDPGSREGGKFHFSKVIYDIENIALPLKDSVEMLGKKFYINLNYVDFKNFPFEHHTDPAEYAELMLACFDTIQIHFGFVPDAIEVILEPENSDWSNGVAQIIGDRIANCIAAAGDTLSNHGYFPDFIAPSPTAASHTVPWTLPILANSIAASYLTEICYHKYWNQSAADLMEIGQLADNNGITSSMLEWWHPNNVQYALNRDLTLGKVSAWQSGGLGEVNINSTNGHTFLYNISDADPNNPVVTEGPNARYYRQYFKYIPQGAQRINATINLPSEVVAFRDSTDLLTIIINATNSESYLLDSLPEGIYGISYSTDVENETILTDIANCYGCDISVTIPGEGVISVVQKTYSIAQQKVWDGEAGTTDWHDPINWIPDGVPDRLDDVFINRVSS